MKRPSQFQLVALLGLSALFVIGLGMFSPNQAQTEPKGSEMPMPVTSTHDLMHLFNEPLYKNLKQEMAKPQDQIVWKTIAGRGTQTAEIANLIALRKNEPNWHELSADLQRAGLQLSRAAESENFEQTRNSYVGLIKSCNACHQKTAPEKAPQLSP
jgi:hypothetical protein